MVLAEFFWIFFCLNSAHWILEFVTEGLSTGTLIKFLSVYPTKEEEYLYPPLTRIKLDEHVIISQEKFESLFPENDLKSADLNTGFFERAKKALAAVETIALSFFLLCLCAD